MVFLLGHFGDHLHEKSMVPLSGRHSHVMIRALSGDLSGVEPPVPIPNTAVKRPSADDTLLVRVWENRSPPGGKGFLAFSAKNPF